MICRTLSFHLYPLNFTTMSIMPAESGFIRTSLLLACVLLHTCSVTSESDRETCYSRKHQGVTVNIRLPLTKGAIMIPTEKPSEKDCILTCCSKDVTPGVKCNLVVYKPPEQSRSENCYLFSCPSEQDCPLMAAEPGVNTYNIFRGVTHPTTKGNGRIISKPATNVNPQLTTMIPTSRPPTTPRPMTTTVTTTTITTTKPTTTIITTTSASSPAASGSSPKASDPPEEEPTEAEVMLQTTPVPSTTIDTTTTVPQQQSTTTSTTQATTPTQSTSTTIKTRPPPRPAVKPNRPRKPSKPLRGPEAHSFKPGKGKTPTTRPVTSSATQKTVTTAPTTTTTSTPVPPTSAEPTAVLVKIDSKERALDADPRPPPLVGSAPGKARFSRMMWKNSLVAAVVITLIFLLLILALVARKAMESFDRRHYTRLELNDLHYEV